MGWYVFIIRWRSRQSLIHEDESLFQIIWRGSKTLGRKTIKDKDCYGYLDGCLEKVGLFRKYF